VAQQVCGRKRQLADDEREGRPSFRESDAVKNEVRDVINGDRRLTVREVAVIWLFLPSLVEESYSFSTDLTVV
jgi:hypothetical protein